MKFIYGLVFLGLALTSVAQARQSPFVEVSYQCQSGDVFWHSADGRVNTINGRRLHRSPVPGWMLGEDDNGINYNIGLSTNEEWPLQIWRCPTAATACLEPLICRQI